MLNSEFGCNYFIKNTNYKLQFKTKKRPGVPDVFLYYSTLLSIAFSQALQRVRLCSSSKV